MSITIEQARAMWEQRSNGRCDGISKGKGGRAWLDGEFQLCELEALCVIIRHECGELADGAVELQATWDQMAIDDAEQPVEQGDGCRGLGVDHRWGKSEFSDKIFCSKCGIEQVEHPADDGEQPAVHGEGCHGVDHYWLTHRWLTGEPGDKTICSKCGIEQVEHPVDKDEL